MFRQILIVVIGLNLTAGAQAKTRFAAYEGPNAVTTGQGGTKVTKHGIDYWTTGTPPRRYQILGVFTDRRYEEWGTFAVGSPKIAKMTLSLGGNAVIMIDQREKSGGSYVMGTGAGIFGGEDVKTITNMQVVKYLND